MKILAIRGSNLASLSGEFAIDFRTEPLASTGLFAISGPTGAGKSTLLDALCLALYERTPRLAKVASRADVPDVAADTVGVSDPRTILRRGAGEGYAEVDFLGHDWAGYRSRWTVRRARGKGSGKLQQTEIQLSRLDDGRILGDHRKTETLRQIEQLVGLSYEQFTRAVLLAQNDFAAFLKTSDDERAQLLETLTGSAAFTRISKVAHERMKVEREALERLRQQLADQAPLPAEARQEREVAIQGREAALKALEQQRSVVDGQLRWHEDWERLKAEEAKATADLGRAQAEADRAQERFAYLAQVELVQEARPLTEAIDRTERELKLRSDAAEAAAKRETDLHRTFADAALVQERAAAASSAAETAEREAQPKLVQAKLLDQHIADLKPRAEAAAAAQQAAALAAEAAQKRLQQVRDELAAVASARQAADAWLAGHEPLRSLAESWQRWEALLEQAAALDKSRGAQEKQRAQATGRSAALAKAHGELMSGHEARKRELEAADLRLQALAQQCAAVDPEAMARRKQDAERRREDLAAGAAAWQAWRALIDRQTAAAARRADHATGAAQALQQAERDDQELAGLRQNVEGAEKVLRAAELAASQNVSALRAELRAGDPCPVCGALEHPYAGHQAVLSSALDAGRSQVAELRRAVETAAQRSAAARARHGAAMQAIAAADRELAEIAAALEVGANAWKAQPILGELSDVGEGDRAAWFGRESEAVKGRLSSLNDEEAKHRALLRQRDEAQAAVNVAKAAAEKCAVELQRVQGELKEAQASAQSLAEQAAQLDQQLESCLGGLDGAFTSRAWRDRWAIDPSDYAARCAVEARQWLQQKEAVATHAQRMLQLQPTLQSAEENLLAAGKQLEERAAQAGQLAKDLSAKQAERATLFAGQAAGEVEAALKAAVERAKAQLDKSSAELKAAELAVVKAGEAVSAARHLVATSLADRNAADAAMHAWLEQFNAARRSAGEPEVSAETCHALLQHDGAWVQQERAGRQALDQALASARGALTARQKSVAEHQGVRPTTKTAEELRAERATRTGEIDESGKHLIALRLELARDDERRKTSADLATQRDRQAARTNLWEQMAELIGSADGKKFRNFAQQLTLDVLLGYANRHLEGLARRYRLRRVPDSLGLLVIDQDMADEVRSVHSLSGGESFLVSLALALGLASLSSNRVRVESLFIDEGFGSLDADSLRVAMDALDSLQAQGRKIGVISHVQEMTERIATRIEIRRGAGGVSRIVVPAPGY